MHPKQLPGKPQVIAVCLLRAEMASVAKEERMQWQWLWAVGEADSAAQCSPPAVGLCLAEPGRSRALHTGPVHMLATAAELLPSHGALGEALVTFECYPVCSNVCRLPLVWHELSHGMKQSDCSQCSQVVARSSTGPADELSLFCTSH